MTRSDLIERLALQRGIKRQEASAIVEEIFETIAATLAAGQDVQIHGFGTFSVRQCAAKQRRDRITGEVAWRPPHPTPHFRPGTPLLSRVR